MADVVRPAVGRVQGGAAIDEADEFLFERSELDPPFANFGDLVGQKRCDVAARRGAIVAEFFGSPIVGMGFRINASIGQLSLDMIWAEIAVAAVVGSAFYGLVAFIERRVTFWHPSQRTQ